MLRTLTSPEHTLVDVMVGLDTIYPKEEQWDHHHEAEDDTDILFEKVRQIQSEKLK
jgi:hypothetical protein